MGISIILLLIASGLVLLFFVKFQSTTKAGSLEVNTYIVKGYVFVPASEGATDGVRVNTAILSLNESDGEGGWSKSVVSSVTTDDQGNFEFTGVPPTEKSSYMIWAAAEGYSSRQVFITVSSNVIRNIDLSPIELTGVYKIWGYVDNASSEFPIEGATVSLGTSQFRITAFDGYYEFTGLPSGKCEFKVTAPHYTPQYIDVNVAGDQPIYRHDFKLETGNQVPPIARFTQNSYIAPTNTPVTFDPSQSADADGTIVKYQWDWEGDGIYDATFNNANPVTHVYSLPGTYHPTLKVTDNEGNTDFASNRESSTIITSTINSVPEVPLGTIAAVSSMLVALLAFVAVPKLRLIKRY